MDRNALRQLEKLWRDRRSVETELTSLRQGVTALQEETARIGQAQESGVLNAHSLNVVGGQVQAIWLQTGDDTAQNVSITTTPTEVASLTFDLPDWVETLFVVATATGQFTNNSGSNFNGILTMVLDDGGASAEGAEGSETAPDGTTAHMAITEVLTVPLSPAGRAVSVTLDARVNAGSTAVNLFGLKVLVFGVRSAFV